VAREEPNPPAPLKPAGGVRDEETNEPVQQLAATAATRSRGLVAGALVVLAVAVGLLIWLRRR
jgi:hypothetical protein